MSRASGTLASRASPSRATMESTSALTTKERTLKAGIVHPAFIAKTAPPPEKIELESSESGAVSERLPSTSSYILAGPVSPSSCARVPVPNAKLVTESESSVRALE